jgi:hypothetical protein
MHRMGRNILTMPNHTSKDLDDGKFYNVAIRIVDIFGNDASSTVGVDLRK